MLIATLALTLALQAGAQVEAPVLPHDPEIQAGTTMRLRFEGARGDTTALRWFSSNPRIATVDSAGTVAAVRPGTATIIARKGSSYGRSEVTVPQLPPATLSLHAADGDLPAGTSRVVDVRVMTRLDDPLDAPVTWTSTAADVAMVDGMGRVWARKAGTATIHAKSGAAEGSVRVRVTANPAAAWSVAPGDTAVRTGDVVRLSVRGSARNGTTVTGFEPAWSVSGEGASVEREGALGVFVAERPGTYRVTGQVGESTLATATIHVRERSVPGHLVTVGRGAAAEHHSADMWAWAGVDGRDYAMIGTYAYDWLKVWDVTDPSHPVITDSVQLDARRINDVKIHPNGRLAVVTREGASNRKNGIVILDLATPAHPTILSEYTETVSGGVHNVWIRGDENLVYACHNGTSDVHIIDIADPAHPREVGRWGLDQQGKVLHDVIVQDGYAYLSYWTDGVIMLDAGAGTHGGTPTKPTLVSQYRYPVPSNTHTAWRYKQYLFVGDEVFPSDWNGNATRRIDARGYIHVLDYSDPEHPREVAKYEVPEAGAHNVWVEDDILYAGYYQAGLRVVDVSGELRGDLYRQGREISALVTTDSLSTVPYWPMAFGAQVFKGNIYLGDLNSGLWIAKLERPAPTP